MKLNDIAELDTELLYVFVFGPGLGESVVVRVPPDHWAVIDSLRRHGPDGEKNPALSLLERFHAAPDVVALTHPHLDHADGLPAILARRRPASLVGCAAVFLPGERYSEDPDAEAVWRTGAALFALSAIGDVWEREPEARLVLSAGTHFPVGAADIEVLHPPIGAPFPLARGYDLNRLSSPMVIRWARASVLLGADLPFREWNAVAQASCDTGDLAAAPALKVSHHGSKTAQHPIAIGSPPPSDRFAVLTPFARGCGLPSFEDDHGVAELLRAICVVHMTSCRVPRPASGTATRMALKQSTRRARFGPELLITYDEPLRSVDTSWVAAGFDSSGAIVQLWEGDEAVAVAE